MPFFTNPLSFPLEFDDEGQPVEDRFVPGSLHWVYYQRKLLEYRVEQLAAKAQVTSTVEDDAADIATLRATVIAFDVAKGVTELQMIETFMCQSGFWDYELDGYDGYFDGYNIDPEEES